MINVLFGVIAGKGGVDTSLAPFWTAGSTASDFALSPGTAIAGCSIETTGVIDMYDSGTDGNWKPAGEPSADYDFKWSSADTGIASNATENVWTSLSSPRYVEITQGGLGEQTVVVTIDIRHRATGQAVSKTVTITATVEP